MISIPYDRVEFLVGSLRQRQPGDSASMGYCLLLNVGLGEKVALSMSNELSGKKEESVSYIPYMFHHFHSKPGSDSIFTPNINFFLFFLSHLFASEILFS
nr:hypothetical protein CFP56_15863 [Quercus suber]